MFQNENHSHRPSWEKRNWPFALDSEILSYDQEKLWQLYPENPTQQQNTMLLSCCSSPLWRASTTITNKGAPRGLDADVNWSDSSTTADGEDDGARESREEPIVQLPASTYTQLNQLLLFISGAFITLDRSPELPSKPLILSHKVYCLCFALHFCLC